ncbi:S46 family peptidase [Aurantivibrio infirmus]
MRKIILLLSLVSLWVNAEEGMWQPHQLPALKTQLTSLGLELDPSKLNSLDEFPMNAIVSLGGCSASFVSPKGLVVTNHHCVYGSVQFNSTPENNLLENGFLAKDFSAELPAVPGSRVYVTESVTNVSDSVLAGVSENMSGLERYQLIEANEKALIADCEKTEIHRCSVPSFHHGLEYFLVKQLEIRDVRLVYAPATSIGKYGGDIDNWQWPRHTGDFGFYRAYVGSDGKPNDYSADNVPYVPASFLQISATGLQAGDFVMAAGYPGSTNRYRTAQEIENQFTWFYPKARKLREDLMDIIVMNSEEGSEARISYESTFASLSNYAKNYQSMTESFQHSDFLQRRQAMEAELAQWLSEDSTRQKKYGSAVSELNTLIEQNQSTKELDLVMSYFSYASLPSVAAQLYRLALEKQKPDEEREPGYQERDAIRFEQSLRRLSRRYDETIDNAMLDHMLLQYAKLPRQQRIASYDKFFKISDSIDLKKIHKQTSKLYKKSTLDEENIRLEWMNKSVEDFQKSKDPFIQYAVATHEERMQRELADKELYGQFQIWRPRYMEALIQFNQSKGKIIYADANSTLRVTFGRLLGNQPKDGLVNRPFTRLEGILEKDTGVDPFNAPKQQLELIKRKNYAGYTLEDIDSVPVNFLTTLDITGGNSGSATLNSKGQLVGLLFDGVYESIIGDWDFDEEKNRAISVDTRYMLWVMTLLDEATNLLEEMDIVH